MSNDVENGDSKMSEEVKVRLEQFKLVYDYIKFHMGLYIATPPVLHLTRPIS
jgi:hypothetical protein